MDELKVLTAEKGRREPPQCFASQFTDATLRIPKRMSAFVGLVSFQKLSNEDARFSAVLINVHK